MHANLASADHFFYILGRGEHNLKAAFRATGIYPFNKEEVLKRMPGGAVSPGREEVYRRVSDSFLQHLEQKRYGEQTERRGGKRLKVSPGKSWAPEDMAVAGTSNESDEEALDDPGKKNVVLRVSTHALVRTTHHSNKDVSVL